MMSDDEPRLGLNQNEILQYVQAANALSVAFSRFSARVRARREREGRLAHNDAPHAARQHEVRQHPPVRLMTDAEQDEWQGRAPSSLSLRSIGEPVTVWNAQMVDPNGRATGQWGLEAYTWDPAGRPTSTALVVCRDAEDALAMTQYLREHGTPEALEQLRDLAARGSGQFAAPVPAVLDPASKLPGDLRPKLVLSEQDWEATLREVLPEGLADRIIIKDPEHKHHTAWRELHELANEEVQRVGADPAKLARLVLTVPRWSADVVNPPALAHWAIKESRTSEDYRKLVVPGADEETEEQENTAAAKDELVRADAAEAPRYNDVRSPEDAIAWAKGLERHNARDLLEAKTGYGRWGDRVDAILNTTFPGIAKMALDFAERERERKAAAQAQQDARTVAVKEAPAEVLAAHEQRVAELDPSKAIHQREAHTYIGHVAPEIDRLIAEKFADNPKIVEKLDALYPDGIDQAIALRNKATAEEAAAAAEASAVDDPSTARREDADGQDAANGRRGVAATERGIASSLPGEQPPVLRRTQQGQGPVQGPTRRT
ncbi:hypothetical protein D5S17_35750 [Pseudonocardiaceae bacterium YIM PH 21723]|nr:hypothetical protein D5S17_35750 [Pseudonocardiaceae bacterium YIM PH 21723]